ncbi:hypothetical protein SAMN06298216_4189 [Spirosomataceae bacterium TFI 002]|nr:hypothetical protein SAMN06298216_4189 [Spirosomataceae bacterium TFI 002]
MRKLLFLLFFLAGLNSVSAQDDSNKLSLLVSSRVDTTSSDVRSIINLYESYYASKPDSIYDNPFWNKKEKELYEDFDFSRVSIFQGGMNANLLFKYFSPFVMSVEPIGEKYQIRVLFSSATTDPKYAGSKVWCIQKLNAIKENQRWVLENLIVDITSKWNAKKLDYFNYIFPPNHEFNEVEAQLGKSYCDEIIRRFNPNYNGSFNYYVTSSKDDMGLLENFDYYFVGITSGKAREGMILTANGNENYPHEFVHKLLPINSQRGQVIEEGLAVYLGTKQNQQEYEKLMSKLAFDLNKKSDKVNFKSVLSQAVTYNGYQTAYPTGAGICELVHELRGDNGLSQLLHADTSGYQEILEAACSITMLTENELEAKWETTIQKYYQP